MRDIVTKFGNMRRNESFTVYPRPTNVGDDYSLIQMKSDHRAVIFDTNTGRGKLSPYAKNYPMVGVTGTVDITVPPEIIKQVQDAQPKPGDRLAGGCVIA